MASVYMQGFTAPDEISVNVWFRSSHVTYQLRRQSTVGELRQRLAADYGIAPGEMKILLGGHLLDDSLTIEDSGVGMESTLFAIQLKPSVPETVSPVTPAPPPPTTTAATETSSSDCGSHPMTAGVTTASSVPVAPDDRGRQLSDQYYVYCKQCRQVQAGRLRVKCSVCDGGAVLLDRGPGGWEDVLTSGRLTGSCQALSCEGSQPVFYFKCTGQHSSSSSSTAVALRHIMPNRRCVPCITCEDVKSPVVVFPCEHSHVMCLGCFETYCAVRLNERSFRHTEQFGYTLPCPAGCGQSYIQEQHHFCVLGGELYERYKDFAAEECLMAEGGLFCPGQDCASGFLVDSTEACVTCPYCKLEFCRHCRRENHDGACLPITATSTRPQDFSDAERAQRAQWEQQTADTIHQTTKACPGCRTPTERDGGCMHMRCWRCGEEWCWLCVKAWDRDCQGAHWFG